MSSLPFGMLLDRPLRSGVTVAAARRGAGAKMLNMGELFQLPKRVPAVDMARVDIDLDPDKNLVSAGGPGVCQAAR